MPELAAWATIQVELFGGLAVLLGALIPLASVPMIAVLLVAIVTMHLPNGFSSIKLHRSPPTAPISDSRATRPTCSIWRH
jgi:putative oxidoreductase